MIEDRGYYEAMHPEQYLPDPWWMSLFKILVGLLSMAAVIFVFGAILK